MRQRPSTEERLRVVLWARGHGVSEAARRFEWSPTAVHNVLARYQRDEPPAREVFDTLLEAKVLVARWRRHYNPVRPHSALGNIAPEVFVRQASARGSCLDLPEQELVAAG